MGLKISGLCSDLDSTLYDYGEQFGAYDYTLAMRSMEDAGLENRLLSEIDKLYTTTSFLEILKILEAKPYSVNRAILKAGYYGYNNLNFASLNPSPDVIPTLEALKNCGIKTSLVSTGYEERQKRKVKMLGLDSQFDEFYYVSDFSQKITKGCCFKRFADNHGLPHNEVMVVGDNITKEIKEGNELDMVTVQILKGRYRNREPRNPLEIPDYKIGAFSEVLEFIGIGN